MLAVLGVTFVMLTLMSVFLALGRQGMSYKYFLGAPYWLASTVLFILQAILVLGTIVFYARLTLTFLAHSKESSAIQEQIRESLIPESRRSRQLDVFSSIYSKIKMRYHIFFVLLLSALLFRTYFYIMLRLNEVEDINGLEIWDPIGPDLVLLMSIEEVI